MGLTQEEIDERNALKAAQEAEKQADEGETSEDAE